MARLNLTIRRCRNVNCSAYKKPDRPEAEGHFALPHYEFGLDVIALVGRRSVPEIRPTGSGAGWSSPSALSPTCGTGTTSGWPSCSPTTDD
ncbi:hypothetical protein [Gemmata massiliana]